jgi:hypothetical protein
VTSATIPVLVDCFATVVEKETGVEVVVKEKTKGVNIFEITYL